jgi:hypothetical protein
MRVLLALVLLGAFVAAQNPSCSAGDRSNCTKDGSKPFCVNAATLFAAPRMECRECLRHADCPANKYCSSAPDTAFMCKEFEPEIVGQKCATAPDWFVSSPTQYYWQGFNEKTFCGKLLFNPDNSTRAVEWRGACVMGKCQVCYGNSYGAFPNTGFSWAGYRRCVGNTFQYSGGTNTNQNSMWTPLIFATPTNPSVGGAAAPVLLALLLCMTLVTCHQVYVKARG